LAKAVRWQQELGLAKIKIRKRISHSLERDISEDKGSEFDSSSHLGIDKTNSSFASIVDSSSDGIKKKKHRLKNRIKSKSMSLEKYNFQSLK
tara:strand:+ start:197 stop:472 length:276 start_codon:yes stop_codon:yes gene_type:complete